MGKLIRIFAMKSRASKLSGYELRLRCLSWHFYTCWEAGDGRTVCFDNCMKIMLNRKLQQHAHYRFTRLFQIQFLQLDWLLFYHRGIRWKLTIFGNPIEWKFVELVPAIRFMALRKFQKPTSKISRLDIR